MVDRNKVEESYAGTMACDNGTAYQLCDSNPSGVGNMTCGDLFSNGNYTCLWNGKSEAGNILGFERQPRGEICEKMPLPMTKTIVSTEISMETIVPTSNCLPGRNLVMGVGYPSFFVFGACVSLASCFL
jgi:hypothetical protein